MPQNAHGSPFKKFDVIVIVITVLSLALTAGAVIMNNANNRDFTGQADVSIDINDSSLSAKSITVSKGTTVTWTNKGTQPHSVMREHDDDDHAHAATTPDNVDPEVFSSPALDPGETYSFTFEEPGKTEYHDSLHPSITGSVTVK